MSMDKLFDGSDAHLLPEIELKQLIEDAAKLLGLNVVDVGTVDRPIFITGNLRFDPLDPERGDLMKVADAAGLFLDLHSGVIGWPAEVDLYAAETFTKGDYQSQALAVLRAASAVLKARGEE